MSRRNPGNPGLEAAPRPEYHPDLIEVQIEPDVVAGVPAERAAVRGWRALPQAVREPFSHLGRTRALREVAPVFADAEPRAGGLGAAAARVTFALARSVRAAGSDDLAGTVMLRFSAKADLAKITRDLDATRGVRRANLVPVRWLATTADPLRNRQWGLRATHWFDKNVPDASGIGVAVLDTGVDQRHPDLKVHRYVHEGTSATDIVGHGTHVSGIIGAQTNNAIGIVGIAQCQLSAYKVFGDEPAADGRFYVDPLSYRRALNAVRTSGDRIVNLSIGGTKHDPTEELLFDRLRAAGVVAVAAMGNDFEQGNPVQFPAAFPDVIAVGASTEANQRAPFSNTGRHITLVAQGQNILSTLPVSTSTERPTKADTQYAAWSGTSMATPHVAAALALLLAVRPELDAAGATERLTATASRLPGMKKAKRTVEFGAGLLNVRDLLA